MPQRGVRSLLRKALIATNTRVHNQLGREMRDLGKLLEAEHNKVVRDWTHRPGFKSSVLITPEYLRIEIRAQGRNKKIWNWVDKGTKGPYPIRPRKRGGKLKFQTGYSARTQPVAQYNVGDARKSGPWVTTKLVMHPGIAPRKFNETISERFHDEMARRIDNVFRAAMRR